MSELVHTALTALTVAAALGWLAYHFVRRASPASQRGCASCPAAHAPPRASSRRRETQGGPRSIRLPVIG